MGWDSVQFETISLWPGVLTKRRERSRFQSTWTATVDLLDRELGMISARKVVCEMAISYTDLRNDGKIRASARPEHPGVILSFETKYGPLRYACDRFDDWQDNVRAIALGLEALRKLDRYGITTRGEQYTGWKALPSGIEMPERQMTTEEAAAFLIEYGEVPMAETPATVEDLFDCLETPGGREVIAGYYRRAAKRLHPDSGGDDTLFRRLTEAKELLGA
jgi:hypothetical protein